MATTLVWTAADNTAPINVSAIDNGNNSQSVLVTLLKNSFLKNGEPSTVFMRFGQPAVSQDGYKSVTRPRLNPMKTTLSQAMIAYEGPLLMLRFQVRMRQLEMEDEVMQFQTIILMLMRIERVNVEIILEWLERYSNIFRDPISKCVNDYESGPWEALEAMKEDVNYPQFIRIVESLQVAVEKIPIKDAFDELETEREYYQEKRKESNERLIARKGRIGKVIGFAPMVALFVGYLIIPLVFMGLKSMTSSMDQMSAMSN